MNQQAAELIEAAYDMLETIHSSEKSTIILIKRKETGERFVLKKLSGRHEAYVKIKDLKHPLLPQIVYAVEDQDETVIIEDYIQGNPLGMEPMTEKETVSVILQLCDVLAYLHRNGIIHRDIKPSNILLTKDKSIRLIDFDAARVEKEDSENDTQLLGTRGYAAPEQYGFAQTSPRSDIYALGVTMGKLFSQISKTEKYKKVIARCTDLNPKKRYRSAGHVVKALKFSVNRPYRIGLTVLAVIVLAVTITVYIGTRQPKAPSPGALAISSPSSSSSASPSASADAKPPVTAQSTPSLPGAGGTVSGGNLVTVEPNAKTPSNVEPVFEKYLFYSDDMKYIFLDGKSIELDGKVADMSVDLDGKGTTAHFKISRDHPNGLMFEGYVGDGYGAVNFYYDDWVKQIHDAFEEDSGDIQTTYYAQISCADLDGDGTKEVLVSIGDKLAEQVTAVYSYTGDQDKPFEYKGYMIAGDYIVVDKTMGIIGPIGSAGLANIYKYSDNKLIQTQEG